MHNKPKFLCFRLFRHIGSSADLIGDQRAVIAEPSCIFHTRGKVFDTLITKNAVYNIPSINNYVPSLQVDSSPTNMLQNQQNRGYQVSCFFPSTLSLLSLNSVLTLISRSLSILCYNFVHTLIASQSSSFLHTMSQESQVDPDEELALAFAMQVLNAYPNPNYPAKCFDKDNIHLRPPTLLNTLYQLAPTAAGRRNIAVEIAIALHYADDTKLQIRRINVALLVFTFITLYVSCHL